MLSNLVYVSSAVSPFTPWELVELLEGSRRKNAKLGITGLLLHIGGNFMQALEGEESAVDALYRTIAEDHRHRSVTTIVRSPIEHRLFTDWKMGFKEVNDLPLEARAQISSFLDDVVRRGLPMSGVREAAPELLRGFALTMR